VYNEPKMIAMMIDEIVNNHSDRIYQLENLIHSVKQKKKENDNEYVYNVK